MHIQARSGTRSASFVDDDDGSTLIVNAAYGNGALAEILTILEDHGFSLRGASGHDIELDGVFSWWVAQRFDADGNPIDDDDDDATQKAAKIVDGEGFGTVAQEVEHADLADAVGSLRAFVEDINGRGGMVEELSVGTPNADGTIPVQAWVSRQS
jgi:hypothetical protein